MGMTKCKECGAEISSKAKACPQCGVDNRSWWGRRSSFSKVFIVLLALTFIVVKGGGDNSTSSPTSAPLITSTSKALLLNIRDFDETGWEVIQEGDNFTTFSFYEKDGFIVSSARLKETITVYPSIDEAIRAYNSEIPKKISIESMSIGDEAVMWEESGRWPGVFRVNNVVVIMEHSTKSGLKSWSRKAAEKIA